MGVFNGEEGSHLHSPQLIEGRVMGKHVLS